MISIARSGFASSTFDFVRFFAALAVLLGHGVNRFFGPYNQYDNAGISEKLFRVLFSRHGSHGVTIFFILSGLFIGLSVVNQVKRNTFTWQSYLGRRLIRLWIVLLPALILTVALDYVGLTYFNSDAIYSNGDVSGSIDGSNSSLADFLGNIFFLQTILVPSFGTNGALWSLTNEFWYYILFPLAVFSFIKRDKALSCISFFVLFSLVCLFIGSNVAIYFPIWLVGVLVIFIPTNNFFRFSKSIWWFLGGLLLTILCLRITPDFDEKVIERVIVSVPFFLFVLAVIANDRILHDSSRYSSVSKKLAGFSFTLYLIHTPILCLIRGWVIGDSSFWKFNLFNFLFYLLIISFILIVAYFISSVTEAHTSKLYKALKLS